jgi:hypothetical protein
MNDDSRVVVAGYSLGRKTDDCQEIDPSLLRFVYRSEAWHTSLFRFLFYSKDPIYRRRTAQTGIVLQGTIVGNCSLLSRFVKIVLKISYIV